MRYVATSVSTCGKSPGFHFSKPLKPRSYSQVIYPVKQQYQTPILLPTQTSKYRNPSFINPQSQYTECPPQIPKTSKRSSTETFHHQNSHPQHNHSPSQTSPPPLLRPAQPPHHRHPPPIPLLLSSSASLFSAVSMYRDDIVFTRMPCYAYSTPLPAICSGV